MERKNRGILKNKLFLYLTEFFSGMSVMAVELGASRLLAPYFSSSQIVWTIIIGTIMIAMALGNIYGGRTADKSPNPDKLYGRIIVAALWIALIPVVGKYIIVGISAVLIFSVNNFMEYRKYQALQGFFPTVTDVCMSALCTQGKILLPILKRPEAARLAKKKEQGRQQLIEAAREGNQEAFLKRKDR